MKYAKLGKELGDSFSEVLESMADINPEESRARVQQIEKRFEELLREVAIRRESMLKVPPVSCTKQDTKELLDSFSDLVNDLGCLDQKEDGMRKIVDRFVEMLWQMNPGNAWVSDSDIPWMLEKYTEMDKEYLGDSFNDLLENMTVLDPEQAKRHMQRIVFRLEELLREAIPLRETTPDMPLAGCTEIDRRMLILKLEQLLKEMNYHCPVEGERCMQKIARKYDDMLRKWARLRDTSKQR